MNVLSHQEMAKIPVVIILTAPNLREKVEAELRDPDAHWMDGRKYVINEMRLERAHLSK